MGLEGVDKITLHAGTKKEVLEILGPHKDFAEFMELMELLIVNSGYSEEQIEGHILMWAEDIRTSRERAGN